MSLISGFNIGLLNREPNTFCCFQRNFTTNTRQHDDKFFAALDVAVAVLSSFTPELRENIRKRGQELVTGLAALADEMDDGITATQGTGLLVSCELASRYKCHGANSTEDYLRKNGLGVIHGGQHSLRYTPVFDIGEKEVKLIIELTKDALLNGPTVR